ncbi:McrB family protein [Aliarcobacter butzleri]|uniref:McrB family protein n=2 Tax=Aliarcobacter butzleri TaxID=28197 RepID=UPI00263DEFEE|nr:AAA family ATPase [Aliarcobacter butzleri]MDN5095339.1 AAA family ATPase [Aliarcobacter butzleri]
MNRKELFREWLKGKVDTVAPLSGYPNALSNLIPSELSSRNENSYKDLFECTDIEYLNKLYTRLSKGGDLHQFNVITQSRLPSASVGKYIEFLKSSMDNNEIKKDKKHNMKTKNIMLYGAPGVGKTHNYKKLVSLIESGKYNESDIFESIIENQKLDIDIDKTFEIIKNEKRIEFVTFHQSYSYEDFIEGFRPSENTHIELEDGIFKLICNKAKNQVKETKFQHISFDEAFDILRTQYIENELDKIYSVSNVEIIIHEFKERTIKVQSSNAKDTQYVKKSDLETVVQSILNNEVQKPSDIKNLDVKKDTISLGGLYYPIGRKIVEIINNTEKNIEEKEKNFYIVIDEINRGNISKIFGELITLIEEDKRDDYEVTLPYSKEKFKIPSNLYIIATMNSTDKSIATIDIALRRRFTFLKMEPKKELVENEKAKALMNELNEHIKETIGKDYQLGHSYFMKIENENDLLFVKEYKIKPLLEEYFYGDEINYNKAIEILNRKDNE